MSKYNRLVEVRYFEPSKKIFSDHTFHLKSLYNHPARFRRTNCWIYDQGSVQKVQEVGREGWFEFVNGKCSNYLGEFEAEILGEIDLSRKMEADRFEAA